MKKLLVLVISILAYTNIQAQIEVGIQFSPNVSYNRVFDEIKDFNVSTNGAGMRFSAGPIFDVYFTDNMALSLGLMYVTKRASMNVKDSADASIFKPNYNVQYVQAPIALKYFTNTITSKMRIYFQLGATIDVRISEKAQESSTYTKETIEEIKAAGGGDFSRLMDFNALVGAGVEMKVGTSNAAFFGLNYNRGLVNIITKDFLNEINRKDMRIHNDYISVVAGFKF